MVMYIQRNEYVFTARGDIQMITMSEIATLTGVSQPTVSRVLNGNTSVNPETARRVWDCAKKHNYQPNIIAQSLAGNKTNLIGVIVTDISNPFFAELIEEIEASAADKGYSIMLFNSDYDREREKKYMELLRRYNVDGALLVPTSNTKEAIKEYGTYDLPLVSVTLDLRNIDSVYISHIEAGQKVADHFLGMGYESFIFIGGSDDEKQEGFRSQLEAAGVDISTHYRVIKHYDNIEQEIKMWLSKEFNTDGIGIFSFNDLMAIKTMEVLKKMKVEIPQDVALVGFDNTLFGKITTPTLTSVSQPIAEMGSKAVQRLIEKIDGIKDRGECIRYQLDTRLIVRDSTVKIKKR